MAEATRILAIRHGQTAWNADGRIQGHTDIALDAVGQWQAERLALALAHEELQAVYSSDLQRAQHTALPLARRLRLQVHTDRGLRERAFGGFEGATFDEIALRCPADAQRWRRRDPDFGPSGGETLATFHARCIETIARLAARHLGQTVAMVAHGGVLDALYRAAARIGLESARTWQIRNASVNRVLYSLDGFAIVSWSDVSHLEAA